MILAEHIDERGIYLSVASANGHQFTVDADDCQFVKDQEWRVYPNHAHFYVVRSHPKAGVILLHRELTEAPKGMEVDHEDGDGLNNRRYNLRVCTFYENQRNRHYRRRSASGLWGVYPTASGRYQVIVTINRKPKGYGTYDDPIVAARVRDAVVWEAFGDFANLNFPKDYRP